MNLALWIVQVVLALSFVGVGILHYVVPEGLPPNMAWMYDLPTEVHYASGTAEILGGLGLILPGVTGVATRLTPLAALGLIAVMGLAAIFHAGRGEFVNIGLNATLGVLAAFVAYGRWRLRPLAARRG